MSRGSAKRALSSTGGYDDRIGLSCASALPLAGNAAINAVVADPKMKARIADMGAAALPGSPADFGRLIAEETEKWARVVKFSGAKPD